MPSWSGLSTRPREHFLGCLVFGLWLFVGIHFQEATAQIPGNDTDALKGSKHRFEKKKMSSQLIPRSSLKN